jgi:hypothetical protein
MIDAKFNAGELLTDIAKKLSGSRLVIAETGSLSTSDTEFGLALAKLALDLKKHPVIQLKAIVEGWTRQRIVRELY